MFPSLLIKDLLPKSLVSFVFRLLRATDISGIDTPETEYESNDCVLSLSQLFSLLARVLIIFFIPFLLVSEWRRDSSSKAASAYESSSPSSSPDGSDVLRSCAYGRCPAAAWWDPVSSKLSRIRYEFGLFWLGYYALFRPQLGSGIHPSSLY